MPEITPEETDEAISVPFSMISSGESISGRDFEYLCRALNLVRHPGETFPHSNLPSSSMKSTVRVVPKSNTVHFLPLKRYLEAITDAALSGVI